MVPVTTWPVKQAEELPGPEAPSQRKVEVGGGRGRKGISTIARRGFANLLCIIAGNPHNHCVRHGLLRPRVLSKSSETFPSTGNIPELNTVIFGSQVHCYCCFYAGYGAQVGPGHWYEAGSLCSTLQFQPDFMSVVTVSLHPTRCKLHVGRGHSYLAGCYIPSAQE